MIVEQRKSENLSTQPDFSNLSVSRSVLSHPKTLLVHKDTPTHTYIMEQTQS